MRPYFMKVSTEQPRTPCGGPRIASWLRISSLVALLASVAAPPAGAWSFEVHRFIAERALELLPDAIRPFFLKHREMIREHAIDPDLWRNVGFEEEPPRHFLDLDAYGAAPFAALPRDYDRAVAKFGRAMVHKNGLLPWRTVEIHGKLVKAFADQKAGRPYALDNIKFFTAVLAHYVADAHVPFHAVVNFDGQQTGQHGIHARFETELFDRFRDVLTIQPQPVVVPDPRDFLFDTLTESARLAPSVLEADRAAIGSREQYDDAYFERFFAGARPTLERRLSESIAAVAAYVTTAWTAGGKPELPLNPPRRTARKRATQ
jgi:hypothetical protein